VVATVLVWAFENVPRTLCWPLAASFRFANLDSGSRLPALMLSRTLYNEGLDRGLYDGRREQRRAAGDSEGSNQDGEGVGKEKEGGRKKKGSKKEEKGRQKRRKGEIKKERKEEKR
jgi:hypothetical protein